MNLPILLFVVQAVLISVSSGEKDGNKNDANGLHQSSKGDRQNTGGGGGTFINKALVGLLAASSLLNGARAAAVAGIPVGQVQAKQPGAPNCLAKTAYRQNGTAPKPPRQTDRQTVRAGSVYIQRIPSDYIYQYPSTLVKQENKPEEAEEHNIGERSIQNVIGQHQLIEPKQEFDQQPTAPVTINAQIKTEPLEIERELTLFNKQLTPKNEHLQLNTEEGTSGNMNGNLSLLFKINENEKPNLLNESHPTLPKTGDMDISSKATPSHGYKTLLAKEKALPQGEKERELGKEKGSVQAENAQATKKEALLRKEKALTLEEGEIEPSGKALLQGEKEREMGEEEASVQTKNVQATEEEALKQGENATEMKEALQQKEKALAIEEEALIRKEKALTLEEGEIEPSGKALLQGEKEREMGEEETSVQTKNVQATEEEALKQGENATEMKEALQQKEKALAIEEEALIRKEKALTLEEGEIEPSGKALLQGEKEREMGEKEASVQTKNVQATEEEALKQGENATEMKEALQQKEKALAIEEEALIRKEKALTLEEGEIEPSGEALLQGEREMGKEEASVQNVQATEEEQHKNFWDTKESKSKKPRNQRAQPSSPKFKRLTIQPNDIYLSPHTQQNQQEWHDQHQQSVQLHQSLLQVEIEQPVQAQQTPNIQTYFSDLSIKETDRFLNTDIEWLIFVTIKAINHPISLSNFQLMWQHKGQSVDEILTLIDGFLFEQTLMAEQIIEGLKAVLTRIGTDVTILSEIGLEMAEFEQKFGGNLPNEAVSTAKELKMLFLFMRLFRKSLILLSEAQTAVFHFSNAVKWVFTINKLENTLAIVEVAILLTSPSSMKTTFKYLGNPTMKKDIFSVIDKNEFLAQFNSWINPWAEPNHLHLIRTKIGKNASSKIVADLGDIFNEQIAKHNETHPNSVWTGNRLLHWKYQNWSKQDPTALLICPNARSCCFELTAIILIICCAALS
uniref:Uncharacterized protein n=1 Tax=Globodera rostochiensis TaxID=31243 RepID=A0A914HJZ2_GLORO